VKLQIPFEQPCAPEPQSDTVVQPHWPPPVTASQACPWVLPEQLLQLLPLFPQAFADVPAVHDPLLQHPPLHADVPLHAVVHTPLLPQAVFAGQSAALRQPHVPPASQNEPAAPCGQFVHGPPFKPQAPDAVPATQLPPLQQPPLQMAFAPHDEVHVWVVVLHASP